MQVARPWLCCCTMSGMFVACLYMLPKSIRALHRDSTEQVCYTQTTTRKQERRRAAAAALCTVDLPGLARQPHAGSVWRVLGRMHLGTLAPIDSRLLLTSPSLPIASSPCLSLRHRFLISHAPTIQIKARIGVLTVTCVVILASLYMFVFHEVRERCVVGGGRAGVGVWDGRRQAWG